MQRLRTHAAADGRVHRQEVVEDAAQHQPPEQQPCREAADAERHLAGVRTSEPDPTAGLYIEGDLRARISGAHEQHVPVGELPGFR